MSPKTWEDYANRFLEFCRHKGKVKQLFIVFDSYSENVIKKTSQIKRERLSLGVFITNIQQKMPRHSDWFTFLRNSHNKTEMNLVLVRHLKSIDV